jgi:hypothetical protein
MQSERIKSQKQTKTLSRVSLALCVLCIFSFAGCTTCPDWCKNKTRIAYGPDGEPIYPGTNPIDMDSTYFPGDVTAGLGGGGDPGGIPIAKKCPNCFCPRKSSGVPISGGTTYTSDD